MKNQTSHGWGQSYQSNSRPYPYPTLWGEVGHNIDGCIIAQMLIKGNKFARGFILNGSI